MRLQQQRPLTAVAATLALATLAGSGAFGQEAPKVPASAPAGTSGNTLELGFEERVRSEEWNNITDYTNARNDGHLHYRMRTRLWATWNLGQDLELSAGLANENRKVVRPDVAYNAREIFFDSLYAKYRFNADWAVKVGRQNIMKGEGFILMDGGALDGSRAAYYNALDVTWTFGHSSLEFIAISDPTRDKYLPRLNATDDPKDNPMRLNEWDERALGLYYTGKPHQSTTVEGYYFFKTELHDFRPATNAMFQPDRRLSTLGGRVTQELGQGWSLAGELAGQSGTQGDRPGLPGTSKTIGAWAGYARAKKGFDVPWKPTVSLGYIGMSGTDPTSSKIGGWDPLFSRWPAYSELYIYSQVPEKGVGYWTNTSMWQAELRMTPWKPLELRATYYKMAAFQAPTAPTALFGTGKDRGDLWQVRADLKLNASLKGHVLYEHMAPGSYYAGQDPGYFFRMELAYTFKARF